MAEATEPPTKKTKKTDNMDEFIENIITSETNLLPIISDLFIEPVPLITCYAGRVKDTKLLSTVIQVLNEKLPLADLQHLKRVNKQCVLLCPMNYLSKINYQSIQDFLETHVQELRDTFEYFKDVEVPSIAPMTKKQYVECSKKWSCNFHPNKYIERLLSGSFFSQLELRLHRTYMGLAFQVASACLMDINCTPTTQGLLLSGVNAAVIVDPTTKCVVTVAFDNRNKHPIQHAAMLAIDNVAKTQNGGAWNSNEESTTDLISKVKDKFLYHHPTLPSIKFGARKFVSKKEAGENENVDDSPYLCTGYDIYLIREPCIMCSMGLVHARIKRIFYMFDNHLYGGVRSKTKLHCVPSLNHRFEVFTGFENSYT